MSLLKSIAFPDVIVTSLLKLLLFRCCFQVISIIDILSLIGILSRIVFTDTNSGPKDFDTRSFWIRADPSKSVLGGIQINLYDRN